jgi:transcriptional regulator with XRE-family HTH domain
MAEKKLTAAERFNKLHEAAQKRDSYYIEAAKVELSEQIYVAMEDNGVSEAELARRIGASRAYVNKVLQGSTNFTIESLVKIGRALSREFTFEFAVPDPNEAEEQVTYIVEEPTTPPIVLTAAAAGNVISISDYKASKSVEVDTSNVGSNDQKYAAIESAA